MNVDDCHELLADWDNVGGDFTDHTFLANLSSTLLTGPLSVEDCGRSSGGVVKFAGGGISTRSKCELHWNRQGSWLKYHGDKLISISFYRVVTSLQSCRCRDGRRLCFCEYLSI